MSLKFLKSLMIILTILFIQNISFAKPSEKISFEMLSPYSYSKMPTKMQQEYMDAIRKIWVEFESKYPVETHDTAQTWPSLFFEVAHAALSNTCIIGGATLNTVSVGKKNLCPTRGRDCDEKPDSFRCGPIFGEACISRTPISNLSKRCHVASASIKTNKQQYEEIVKYMEMDFNRLCIPKPAKNTKDGCYYLAQKMNEIAHVHNIKIASLDEYNKAPQKKTSDSTPSWTNAYGVNIPGCPNGGHENSAVPQFGLTPDKMCAFDNNRNLLGILTQKGCKTIPTNNIFTTIFSPVDKSILLGESNSLSTIVESVTVQEQKSKDDILYNLQILKPNLSTVPTHIQRRSITIRQQGARYFMLDPNSGSTEVDISNNFRPNFLIKSEGITTNFPVRNYLDGKVNLSDDCRLAQQLKSNGLYQTPIAIPGPTSASGGSH